MSNNEAIDNQNEEPIEEFNEQDESPKGPSAVSLFVDKIKIWLNRQNKALVAGVTVVIIGTAGYLAYQYLYKIPKEKKGQAAIFKIEQLFDSDSFAQVSKMAPKLADEYSGTKAGNLARYMAGVSALYTGDFKNAVKHLEDVSFDDNVMSVQIIGLLGDAYVENKEIDKGLSQYEKAFNASKNELSGVHWGLKAARVHEKKGEWQDALDIYNKIKKDYKGAEGTIEIDKNIARAEAQLGKY